MISILLETIVLASIPLPCYMCIYIHSPRASFCHFHSYLHYASTPGITDRKKDTSRVLFVADGNRCPWNLRALITSLCPGGRATITGRLSGSSTNDRMKVDSVFFFFFLGKGGERDLTGFLFFFASFVEGKIFSLSFSFRFSIDRTGCSSRYSETERFASHKQFRKSFSFMRFCNNWFTSILLGIMQVFYIVIYFQSCLLIFEKF